MRTPWSLRGTALFIALALLSSILAAAPPRASAATRVGGYELWVTAGSVDGYLAQPDGDWQWLSESCRDEVEAVGLDPLTKDWGTDSQPGTIAYLRATGERVREPCADLVARLAASISPPTPQPPTEPTELMAPVDVGFQWRTASEIAVTWTYRSNDHDGFELRAKQNGQTKAETTSGKQTRWQTLSGLNQNSQDPYCVEVRAFEGPARHRSVSDWVQTESCENTTPPPIDRRQPVNLSATTVLPETVKLTWSLRDAAGNPIDDRVELKRNSETIATFPAGVEMFFDSGLTSNRDYCYELRMADGSGDPVEECVRTGTIVDFEPPNPIVFESDGEPTLNPAWVAYLEASYGANSVISELWEKSGVDRYMNNAMWDFADRLQEIAGQYEYHKCFAEGGGATLAGLLEGERTETLKKVMVACVTAVWKEFMQESSDALGFTDSDQLAEQLREWSDYFQANEFLIDCLAGTLGALSELDLDDVTNRKRLALQLFKGCTAEAVKSYPIAPWNMVDDRNLTWQDYRAMMFVNFATNAAVGGVLGGVTGIIGGGLSGILEHWLTTPYPLIDRVDQDTGDWLELLIVTFDNSSITATQQEKAALLKLGEAINCAPGGCGATISSEHHRRLVTYWTRAVADLGQFGVLISDVMRDLDEKNGSHSQSTPTGHQSWWLGLPAEPGHQLPTGSSEWPTTAHYDTVDGVARVATPQIMTSLASYVFGPVIERYGDNVSRGRTPCRYQPTAGASAYEAQCAMTTPSPVTLEWVSFPDDKVRVLPAGDNTAYYYQVQQRNTSGRAIDDKFIGAWGSLEASWTNSDYMCYSVRAINHIGVSGWFELPCEQASGVSGVTASTRQIDEGFDQIEVIWNHEGPPLARFEVELYRRNPDTAQLDPNPVASTETSPGAAAAALPDPRNAVQLEPGEWYCAFVNQINSTGPVPSPGTRAGAHCAKVDDPDPPPLSRLPVPTQMGATLVATDTLSIDWRYGDHGQDGFEIQISPIGGGSPISVDVRRGDTRSIEVTYDDSLAHQVTIRAYRSTDSNRDYSPWSAALTVPPIDVPPPASLNPPTNVAAAWANSPQARITWDYDGATPAGFDIKASASGVPTVEARTTGASGRSAFLELRPDITWTISVRTRSSDNETSAWATGTLGAQNTGLTAHIAGPESRTLNGQTGQPITFQLDGSASSGDIDYYAWWLVDQTPGIAALEPPLLNSTSDPVLDVRAEYGFYGPGPFPDGVKLTYALVACEGVSGVHEVIQECKPDGWDNATSRGANIDLVTVELLWPDAAISPSPLSAEIRIDQSTFTARDSGDGVWPLREGPNGEPGGDLTASVPGGLAAETPYVATVLVRNTGTESWPAGGSIYLGSNLDNRSGQSNELIWFDAGCGGAYQGNRLRQLVTLCKTVPRNGWVSITFGFWAPDWTGPNRTDGTARLALRMYDGTAFQSFGETETIDYEITPPADRSGE